MKRVVMISSLAGLFSIPVFSQNNISLADAFIKAFSSESQKRFVFQYHDPLRYEWRRTPGVRNGLALYELNAEQKKILHRMMSSVLTTAGYNKITHILFNEDLSKEFDPETGQNKYWVAVYGKPADTSAWGWRLEGHHLSIHFTFRGNKLVAATPFELGSYPAVIEKDTVRAGFRNLANEIDLGFELVQSLSVSQLSKAQVSKTRPREGMMGERNKISVAKPVGISYKELSVTQQTTVNKLIEEVMNSVSENFKIDYSDIHFAWWGPLDGSGTYWYRLHSNVLLIDFEDIGNHIHYVWRMLKNDFGSNPYTN